MNLTVLRAAAALLAVAAGLSGAAAAPCPPDALGVSRTLKLDTRGGFSVGLKTYPRTLALGDHLLAYLPLAARIKAVLEERPSHTARATRFLEELEDHMSEEYAERTLKSVITWGRYGEVFAYDETSETLSLENPQ